MSARIIAAAAVAATAAVAVIAAVALDIYDEAVHGGGMPTLDDGWSPDEVDEVQG